MRWHPSALLAAALGVLLPVLLAAQTPAQAKQLVFQAEEPCSHACKLQRAQQASSPIFPPAGTDDRSILFDRWSLTIAGERTFIFSGEFHPWRLPVPELWEEVLRQFKAAGFNAVSIYTSWALSQPTSRKPPALTGFNDLDRFLDVAEHVGIYVIVRPGPYINAETTVGGVPGWATRLPVVLRTNATEFTEAWRPYMKAIADVVNAHQVSWNGKHGAERRVNGSVIMLQIDNEYQEGPARGPYMRLLADTLKYEWNVRVPISYNDAGRGGNFLSLLGSDDDESKRGPLDLWGIDFYPQRFDCSHPESWHPTPFDWADLHEKQAPSRPHLIPEYQAGSYDPYGGPGYDACYALTNADQYTRTSIFAALSARATILSMYMLYGGTNWGALADPQTYASYDYGAALSESLQPTDKLAEYRIQGHFLRTLGSQLAKTEVISAGVGEEGEDSAAAASGSRSPDVHATHMLNPDSGTGFYFLRHANSTDNVARDYRLEVDAASGSYSLPPREAIGATTFRLPARHADVIVTDWKALRNLNIAYTTCLPLYHEVHEGKGGKVNEVVYLSMPLNATSCFTYYEARDGTALKADVAPRSGQQVSVQRHGAGGLLVESGPDTTMTLSGNPLENVFLSVLPREGAKQFFAPDVAGIPRPAIVAPDAVILDARFADGELHLSGKVVDGASAATVRIVTSSAVGRVFFNDEPVQVQVVRTGQHDQLLIAVGVLRGLSKKEKRWQPPTLAKLDWSVADTLPEVSRDHEIARMTLANKTDSINPHWQAGKGISTEGQVLFAQEYGYHGNWIVWAGSAEITEADREVELEMTVMGGASFAFSVWVNGEHVGSGEGDQNTAIASIRTKLPKDLLRAGETARIVVVHDHMGVDMASGLSPFGLTTEADGDAEIPLDYSMKLPRGIISYALHGAKHRGKIEWRVAGNPGAEDEADEIRTNLNNGGLYAEQQGWHLPQAVLKASTWRRTQTEWKAKNIAFFRASVPIDVPAGVDTAIHVRMPPIRKEASAIRALIFVNGWNYGKWVSNMGPQRDYFLPRGIINHHGENTIAIAVWCVAAEQCELEEAPQLVALHHAKAKLV